MWSFWVCVTVNTRSRQAMPTSNSGYISHIIYRHEHVWCLCLSAGSMMYTEMTVGAGCPVQRGLTGDECCPDGTCIRDSSFDRQCITASFFSPPGFCYIVAPDPDDPSGPGVHPVATSFIYLTNCITGCGMDKYPGFWTGMRLHVCHI